MPSILRSPQLSYAAILVFAFMVLPAWAAPQSDTGGRTVQKRPTSGGQTDRNPPTDQNPPANDAAADDVQTRLLPPNQRPGGNIWKLGVSTENLDTGVRITAVVGNSPAQRAGLERGDLIVTVNGVQVGRVANRTIELSEELQRQADNSGRVRLLLQNKRNNQLENRDVQLERGPGGNPGTPGNPGGTPGRPGGRPGNPADIAIVKGTVTYRERLALPAGAVLTIRITEVGRRGSGLTLADRTFSNLSQVPISFDLRYDARRIDSTKTYELTAEISADGRKLFESERPQPVITLNNPTLVDLTLRRSR